MKHTWSILFFASICLIIEVNGANAEEEWRREAIKRIEQIRKTELFVRVTDVSGKPMPGVSVHTEMVRHAFPWGTCVKAAHITGEKADDNTYREKLIELFNCAVLENALKWNAWHGAFGPSFSRDRALSTLNWLKEREFRIRGHCMVWPSWEHLQPLEEQLKHNPAQLQKRILDHIDEMAAFTKPYVAEWDVVNEPIHENEVIRVLGDACVGEWFSRARAALPSSCSLFINEYNIVSGISPSECDEYERLIRQLLGEGVPLEGIGFQSHFVFVKSMPEILKIFDRFARFGLPITVTEFDINIKNEEEQAAFTRDFMTAVFSHPACNGVVFWGFWEGSHWRPDAALYRKDWSEKPNLDAYRNLVHEEWWTDERGLTNEDGEFKVRGYKGRYQIRAGKREKTVNLGDTRTVVEMVQ